MLAHLPTPGTLFAARYRVEAILGTGGMGVVLAVTDEKTGVECALKLLSAPELQSDRARLVREARALMLISSPHVVRVFDVDEVEGVGPYLVLERLRGKDLGALSPVHTKMPWADVAFYTRQACEALAAAHAAGIIHRDIKPSNLFLASTTAGPIIKVLDFGISKVGPGDGLGSLTSPDGGPLGSPQFISPEQIHAPKSVDARTDVWALGAVMYRLLSGEFPFNGSTVAETFSLVLRADRTPVSDLVPEAPPELCAVIERCLERDVAKRYSTVSALGEALEPFAPQELPTQQDVEVSAAREVVTFADASKLARPLPRSSSRRGPIIFVLAGMTVPLAVVAALELWRSPPAEPAPPPDSAIVTTVASGSPNVVIVVHAPDKIESVTVPGLRRLELDDANATITVAAWTGRLPVHAHLANGSEAAGDVIGDERALELAVAAPVVSAAPEPHPSHAPAKPHLGRRQPEAAPATPVKRAPEAEPSSAPTVTGLRQNPYYR